MTELMPEVDEPVDDRALCPECDERIEHGEAVEVYDYLPAEGYQYRRYHSECRTICPNCSEWRNPDDVERFDDLGASYCTSCMTSCYSCGTNGVPPHSSNYNRRQGEYYCTDCQVDEADQVQPYGHTRASRWLRLADEPGRRSGNRDLYYCGIELEIGTDQTNVRSIRDWSQQHLGYRDAIVCKEDSSVEGFEIVTQPMTPAFFESRDWESFFDLLNDEYPNDYNSEQENEGHGLHVHIGRTAFGKDDIMVAAYCYLLSQSSHLERIGRRAPTGYCNKVANPVKVAIATSEKNDVQARRIKAMGIYPGRDAINLSNEETIEIRAFRSTRQAQELKDAVRVTYLAAEYVRSLRESRIGLAGNALHWKNFAQWVELNMPEAHASIAGK